MERYEITGKILLSFLSPQEQYDVFLGPGDGYLLRRGQTIFLVTSNGTEESITQPHAIEHFIRKGTVEFVGLTKNPRVDLEKAKASVSSHLAGLVEMAKAHDFHGMVEYHISNVLNALEKMVCKSETCDNEARYTSDYCAICDIRYNEGKGERR